MVLKMAMVIGFFLVIMSRLNSSIIRILIYRMDHFVVLQVHQIIYHYLSLNPKQWQHRAL